MGQANFLVPVALVAFVVFAIACFATLEPRRALLVAMFGGWLFLPQYDLAYHVPVGRLGFVPGVLLATSVLFDWQRWTRFRPVWLDLPIALYCLGAPVTAFDNDLGLNEMAAAMVEQALSWGAPYLLGRAYLGSPRALTAMGETTIRAALLYVPLAAWEMRMSPQLHSTVYGFRTFVFGQSIRWGGYRPSVFLVHGLALGMLMTLATLVAFWRWRTGRPERILRLSPRWVFAVLLVTTILVRSTNAVVLLGAGMLALEAIRRLRTAWIVVALAAVPPAYCAARIAGWDPDAMVQAARELVNVERAASVQFRVDNEAALLDKAMIRPWLGWGRFGRSFIYDENRQLRTVTDSFWIIVLGVQGILGLAAIGAALVMPPLALARRHPARFWVHPELASAAALAVALLLWAVDCLLNSMAMPQWLAISGGLVSTSVAARAGVRRVGRTRSVAMGPAGASSPA